MRERKKSIADSAITIRLYTRDLVASLVVFLAAIPLCMGVSIASGVPPARGLVTGIIGGIGVSLISGSPLQVSGPAAGLAVFVAELVQNYGLAALGPVVLLAGILQMIAGLLKLGHIFRAMSPGVIYGMLAGIGVLIVASQFQVAVDTKPYSHGLDNILAIPNAIYEVIHPSYIGTHYQAALVSCVTISTMLLWDGLKPASLRFLPGALIAVVFGTIFAEFLGVPIQHITVPQNLSAFIQLPQLTEWLNPGNVKLLIPAIELAFIASAESLLSAIAVDRFHQGARTDFNRELIAQGLGNITCGFLGGLPMTGVIVRSSINVSAGAKTRFSSLLHGCWILFFAIATPSLLNLIPTACLASILVVVGMKMIDIKNILYLKQYGRLPMIIFSVTLVCIIAVDLMMGILVGILFTALALMYQVSRLKIKQEKHDRTVNIYLEGTATFMQLPKLAANLDRVPPRATLNLNVEKLVYIDHSCMDFVSTWMQRQEQRNSNVTIQGDQLKEVFAKPFIKQ